MIFQGKETLKERGSIMLEVIAVLALMGVMGAMLFRQIYLRNQELHNVQMASEMRTVKEAYSACLQAQAQTIISSCATTINALGPGGEDACTFAGAADCVKEYLPSGWFPDNTLQDYYNFYTYAYKQKDSSQKVKIYGLVIPKKDTLPATGWNFKRAARVSLLIGADGGVYDEDVTGNDINGSLGTWSLDKVKNMPSPTYVAITGLDIFTPEYDVPEGKVSFPEKWDLQLQNLNVYRQFSVAGSDSCLGTINHNTSDVDTNGVSQVRNDGVTNINTSCLPSFWVESSTDNSGNVFVRNDLNVGMDSAAGTPAVRISKNGTIVFNQTVTDPQDTQEKSYVLDPAYTSVMNDIKLMSRGGAKLSDILPDYILKGSCSGFCSLDSNGKGISTLSPQSGTDKSWCDIKNPDTGCEHMIDSNGIKDFDCPQGYKKAILLTPVIFGRVGVRSTLEDNPHTHANGGKITEAGGADNHTHSIPATSAASNKYVTDIKSCALFVRAGGTLGGGIQTPNNGHFIATIGYRNQDQNTDTKPTFCSGGTGTKSEAFHVRVDTYCVFDKDNFKTSTGANYNFVTLAPSTRTFPINNVGSLAECRALGGINWNASTKECN